MSNLTDNTAALQEALASLQGKAAGSGGATSSNDGAEIFVVTTETVVSLYQAIFATYGFQCQIKTQVVETLPDSLEQSTLENGGTIYVYVVESEGVAYGDLGIGVGTVGWALFEADGYDKGWSSDVASETEMGVYAVRKSDICKGDTTIYLELQEGESTATLTRADWVKVQGDFENTSIRVRLFALDGYFVDIVLQPSAILSAYFYGCTFDFDGTWNIHGVTIENGVATHKQDAINTL